MKNLPGSPPQVATGPSIVVISDLHVGAGPLDDFDAGIELELVSFLNELTRRPSPVQLVINGDFLEFIQAEPWDGPDLRSTSAEGQPLCFTEVQSLSKLRAIVRNHPNVFNALGRFLAGNEDHKLTILPGNHDPDLFWEQVRVELLRTIQRTAKCSIDRRFEFALSQVYRPPDASSVWIEHGHQHDLCNSFIVGNHDRWSEEYPPYLPARTGELRLIECVGTRFLLKFLNRLDAAYPFVDNVKPFSKFIKIFGASAMHPAYGPVPVSVAMWNMMRFLATTVKSSPKDFLSAVTGKEFSITELVRKAWLRMSATEKEAVMAALRSQGVRLSSPVDFLVD